MRWFTVSWWKYLLAKPLSFRAFICRIKGHPAGIVFYNLNGQGPDYHCKNCGDDLG